MGNSSSRRTRMRTPNPDRDRRLSDLLLKATSSGQVDEVFRILSNHPHIVTQCSDPDTGKTALHHAAQQGYVSILSMLVQAGADLNVQDFSGRTYLHMAALCNKSSQPDIFDILLKCGADPDIVDKSGDTALNLAAGVQSMPAIQLLLEAGANPSSLNKYGHSALHRAIERDSRHVIELLCDAPEMDFSLRDVKGCNVLHYACERRNSFAVAKILTRAHQLVDVPRGDGDSALHLAALLGHQEIVHILVTQGQANIDLTNDWRQSALFPAVVQARYCIIEFLVKMGADINIQDLQGNTVLHYLLEMRARIRAESPFDDSPFIHAIFQDIGHVNADRHSIAIACFLIQQGVSTDVANNSGQRALDYIDDRELRDLLLSYKFAPDADDESSEAENPRRATGGECFVCSEPTEENVRLEPCNHAPACEDCSSRLKKCLLCRLPVRNRMLKNGQVVQSKSTWETVRRMRHLEMTIDAIEKSQTCNICMDRKRNSIFMCGHGTCSQCAELLSDCHLCRRPIRRILNLY